MNKVDHVEAVASTPEGIQLCLQPALALGLKLVTVLESIFDEPHPACVLVVSRRGKRCSGAHNNKGFVGGKAVN